MFFTKTCSVAECFWIIRSLRSIIVKSEGSLNVFVKSEGLGGTYTNSKSAKRQYSHPPLGNGLSKINGTAFSFNSISAIV